MPYPLPEGDAYEPSYVWRLIAVPDRPEYLQAGLGHLTDLAHWYFWGLEGREPGSEDAAQSWHIANAATLELWDMNPLQTLIDQTDELESLLRQLIEAQCCAPGGGPVGGYDGEVIGYEGDIDEPPNVTPGSELPPGWVDHPDNPGDGSWNEALYRIALCDQINRLADAIGSTLRRWASIGSFNAFSFARELAQSVIAFLFPGRVDDLILWAWDAYYDAVDAIGDWVASLLGLNAGQALAQIYADWVDQARNDFVCALFLANDADSGAEAARGILQGLHGGTAWSLIWSAFPMRFIVRRMFDMEMGYEGPYQSSCAGCEEPFEWFAVEDFEDTEYAVAQPFNAFIRSTPGADGLATPDGSTAYARANPRGTINDGLLRIPRAAVDNNTTVEPADSIEITRLVGDLFIGTSYAPKTLVLRIFDQTGAIVESRNLLPLYPTGAWVTLNEPIAQTYAGSLGNITLLEIYAHWNDNGDNIPYQDWVFVDNLEIRGNTL